MTNGQFVVLPGPDNKFIEDMSNAPTTAFAVDPSNSDTIYLMKDSEAFVRAAVLPATEAGNSEQAQAIILPPACVNCFFRPAVLAEDSGFRGRTFFKDCSFYCVFNLTDFNFNDVASSVAGGSYGVVLYEHANRGGRALLVCQNVTIQNLEDIKLGWFYTWNDKASSVSLYGGTPVCPSFFVRVF